MLHALWRDSLARLELSGAVIFADEQAASALAWAIGLPALLQMGVHNVIRLGESAEVFRQTGTPPFHAVVLCSSFLPDAYRAIELSLRGSAALFRRVTIASSYSERAHVAYDNPEWTDHGAYEACRSEVVGWMRGGLEATHPLPELRVVPLDVPLHLCPIGSGLFVLPLSGALPAIETHAYSSKGSTASQRAENISWSDLERSCQRSLGGCAAALAGLLKAAGSKPLLFALGPRATLLARQVMQHLPAHPPHSAAEEAISLLVVDRTVDFVSPSVRTDHPLEQMLTAPPSHPHVPTSAPSTSPTREAVARRPETHPAAIPVATQQRLAANETGCAAIIDNLLPRRCKEIVPLLLKTLVSLAAESDDFDLSLPTRATSGAVRDLSRQLRASRRFQFAHAAELQAVEALLDAMDGGAANTLQAEMISHQKLVQHTASESPVAAMKELIALARRAHNSGAAHRRGEGDAPEGLGVRDVLPLIGMFYSLAGSAVFASEEMLECEQRLRESLLQACLRDPHAGGFLHSETAPRGSTQTSAELLMQRRQASLRAERFRPHPLELADCMEIVFARLRALARARLGMGPSEALLLSSSQTAGDVYRPLLRYTLERAMRHEPIDELSHLTASIGSFFSRGATYLGVKTTSAKLSDARTILVFVIGGITLAEVRELRQLLAQYPKSKLLLGSTEIASTNTTWEYLTAGLAVRA
ncbi:hypothetical protein AB1Y20_022436 [Prymnesium parvum]|uniref:Sec1 family domain-containing protein 2 n=1 Tax=Prymnesium parvum TaxID=97485 RepID=A0AB34JFW2_PRYPA